MNAMSNENDTTKQESPSVSSQGPTDDQPSQPQSTASPDESQLKLISALGYLGLLFLVPYLMFPKDKFAVFHANQGLILLIAGVIINVIGGIVPVLGWIIILPLGNIALLALLIFGAINAFNGHMKRLPLIGNFDLLTVQKL